MTNFKYLIPFWIASLIIGLIFTGCNSNPSITVAPTVGPGLNSSASAEPSNQASFYHEAPMLTDMVAAGKLPLVDERMPSNPMLIKPEEKIGVYGGTWHMAMAKFDTTMLIRSTGYEGLVRFDPEWTKVIPNVAQSYEANAEATEFTFKLREGMRWSDGAPFTADDILFWYEIYKDSEFKNEIHSGARLAGWRDRLVVEKTDDYTVVFRFSEPFGLFLQYMASPSGEFPVVFPKHYLQQFHPAYNPEIDKLVAQEGLASWTELFTKKQAGRGITNPEHPVLNAWIIQPGDTTPGSTLTAIRNPYYWKIDTDFNQLPYIDRVEFAITENSDEVLAQALAGKIDMQDRSLNSQTIALPHNMAKGGYGLYDLVSSYSNVMAISFNMTHPDAVKCEIFQNLNFRIGLSHAINRTAIMKASGVEAEQYQVAPVPNSPMYNERLATQYLNYDVDLANEYLDRAGYIKRDAEGFRLGPDGRRISLAIMVADNHPYFSFIQKDWQAVGIEMKTEVVPRGEFEDRVNKNGFDAAYWGGEGGYDVVLTPRYYLPTDGAWSLYAIAWAKWYDNPNDPIAQEPPAIVQQQMNLYRQLEHTGDVDEQISLMKQILEISADQFYTIGIHQSPLLHGVVKSNFHNVPNLMFSSTVYLNPAPTNPCQYFINPQK